MRVYIIMMFLITSTAGHVGAAVEANTAIRQYDDSKTQVTSPHLEVKGMFLGDRATVGAGYAMDIVSSASSDVKSFASKPISDTREEFEGSIGWLADDGSYSWGYINSKENDYESDTYSVGASKDFFEKNTTVGLGFSYGNDDITSSANKNFKEKMTNQNYGLNVTQVLSRVSVLQLLYDLRVENGYTASPYRKARVTRSDGTLTAVPENHPRTRNRNSLAVKLNYFIKGIDLATSSSFRFYTDSWLVNSWTAEERLTKDFSKYLSVAFNVRYYSQAAASFYQDVYNIDPGAFYSGNKTLATYDTMQVGLRPLVTLSDKLKLFVKGEYYTQDFKDHTDVGILADDSDNKKLKIQAYIIGAGLESKF